MWTQCQMENGRGQSRRSKLPRASARSRGAGGGRGRGRVQNANISRTSNRFLFCIVKGVFCAGMRCGDLRTTTFAHTRVHACTHARKRAR